MWTYKYKPESIVDFIGNEEPRLHTIKWLLNWVKGTKPILLIGPPGVGKTSFVHCLSRDFDYDCIELNASDTRNKDSLEHSIVPIFNNSSIFGKKVLLFIDEVDGISGREDSGGLDTLIKLLKNSNIPIVIAANTRNNKIKDLMKNCKVLEYNSIGQRQLNMFLRYIIKKMSLSMDDKIIDYIVKHCNGDVRKLLNMLQSFVSGYLTSSLNLSKIDIEEGLNQFFTASSITEAYNALNKVDSSLPDTRLGLTPEERRKDLINAIYSSVINAKLDISSLADVLDNLSKIDISIGRINLNRSWHLMRYVNHMLIFDIFPFIKDKNIKYNQYSLNWFTIRNALTRGAYSRYIISEYSDKFHCSSSTFGSLIYPYILFILSHSKSKDLLSAVITDEKSYEYLKKEMEYSI